MQVVKILYVGNFESKLRYPSAHMVNDSRLFNSSINHPTLMVEQMSKAYPGVQACDDIEFEIAKGEIHSLLGENGAGKSTLVKMIYGLVRPDTGLMHLNGEEYVPNNPRHAREWGVAMVFQHFSLFEAMSVAENILLSLEHVELKGIVNRIRKVSETYGLALEPDHFVGDLSAGERQRVEIVRCLLQNPKLLIMDEPTSVLTQLEVDALFQTLRQLSDAGVSILYISHKLEEVRQLCDNATILRAGKVIATCIPQDETASGIAEMMVGTKLVPPSHKKTEVGERLLVADQICINSANPFGTSLKSVSLEVKAGEILGIAGIAGNGQDELLAALSGEVMLQSGEILISGMPVQRKGPGARRKLGLVAAPEQRLGHAAAPDMTLIENAFLTGKLRKQLSNNGFINWNLSKHFSQSIVDEFDVQTTGVEHAARSLSGGNLQKFLIGREILQEPNIFVVNQPTWGVDASAAASIRQYLIDLAESGAAILAISQDLDELLEIADMIAVLYNGQLSNPLPPSTTSRTEFGMIMTGTRSVYVAA